MITKPQRKLLFRIQAAGSLTQNSKARTMVEALEKAGLINVEMTPRRGAYPGYTLTPAFCKHGRMKMITLAGCSECEDEFYEGRERTRCPTCGKLGFKADTGGKHGS